MIRCGVFCYGWDSKACNFCIFFFFCFCFLSNVFWTCAAVVSMMVVDCVNTRGRLRLRLSPCPVFQRITAADRQRDFQDNCTRPLTDSNCSLHVKCQTSSWAQDVWTQRRPPHVERPLSCGCVHALTHLRTDKPSARLKEQTTVVL